MELVVVSSPGSDTAPAYSRFERSGVLYRYVPKEYGDALKLPLHKQAFH